MLGGNRPRDTCTDRDRCVGPECGDLDWKYERKILNMYTHPSGSGALGRIHCNDRVLLERYEPNSCITRTTYAEEFIWPSPWTISWG